MSELVLCHVTEGSVLHQARGDPRFQPYVVAGRERFATCSGAAWIGSSQLAVVNLYGGHLRTYRYHFESGSAELELVHELQDGLSLPENVAVSPDGTRVAVTHSQSERIGVTVHNLDGLAPGRGTVVRAGRQNGTFHGINFSPDGRYLAFTEIGNPGFIEVVETSAPLGELACLLENRRVPLKPKSIAFSPDGRFAAVAMSGNATIGGQGAPLSALLALHTFDPTCGVLSAEPVAELGLADGVFEMCTFAAPKDAAYRILVVDQAADAIRTFDFNPDERIVSLATPFARGLSFPHGISVSPAGFVAVTNYGDDTLRILR